MKNKNSVPVKAIILITLLLLPGSVYLYLITEIHKFSPLPFYGPREAVTVIVDGEEQTDTIYHSIADFNFINQNGNPVSEADYEGKIYVADFFFTTCQSICPIMTSQLERVQAEFAENEHIAILSHTVDPEMDSVEALKAYAENRTSINGKWNFVTGDKKELYRIARKGYMLSVAEGDGGPDDFIHSPLLVLIDKEKHIRGYYDGTIPEEVDVLINDIKVLIAEYIVSKKK